MGRETLGLSRVYTSKGNAQAEETMQPQKEHVEARFKNKVWLALSADRGSRPCFVALELKKRALLFLEDSGGRPSIQAS